LNEDGVKLVNEYARLKEEREKLDAVIKEVEEAIVVYAKKHEIEVMQGSDKKLFIKIGLKPKFPAWNDPRRRELEELLKKSNYWLEVSELNSFLLSKAIEAKALPPALEEQVKKFMEVSESKWMKLFPLEAREKRDLVP